MWGRHLFRGLGVVVLLLSGSDGWAKRSPPPILTPLEFEGNRIETRFIRNPCLTRRGLCSFQVFVVSTPLEKRGKGSWSWRTEIFERDFTKDRETDVQEIHPMSLSLKEGLIQVSDELGKIYRIDPKTGFLITPTAPIFYED